MILAFKCCMAALGGASAVAFGIALRDLAFVSGDVASLSMMLGN